MLGDTTHMSGTEWLKSTILFFCYKASTFSVLHSHYCCCVLCSALDCASGNRKAHLLYCHMYTMKVS